MGSHMRILSSALNLCGSLLRYCLACRESWLDLVGKLHVEQDHGSFTNFFLNGEWYVAASINWNEGSEVRCEHMHAIGCLSENAEIPRRKATFSVFSSLTYPTWYVMEEGRTVADCSKSTRPARKMGITCILPHQNSG